MPTPVNIQSELDRHRAANAERMQVLVDQQYNTEITRGIALEFVAQHESDAVGLGRLLFAKGLRLLQPTPTEQADGTWLLRVGVKRSLREITSEEFICDLITLGSGVHSCFERWELLSDESAESSQVHPENTETHGQAQ